MKEDEKEWIFDTRQDKATSATLSASCRGGRGGDAARHICQADRVVLVWWAVQG
jgi:hypothetical protein